MHELDRGFSEALANWETQFRRSVEGDGKLRLLVHLRTLGLKEDAGSLLEGTILLVRAAAAFLALDNRALSSFLDEQSYAALEPTDQYELTFLLAENLQAKLRTDSTFRHVDLADLYGMPWPVTRTVGFGQLFISRTDGRHFSPNEIQEVEDAVLNDLRFDYTEDELKWFSDPDSVEGVIIFTFNDVAPED